MHPATYPLVMNMAVAALFAASYVAIAALNRGYRAPIWFAASYGVGMLTPLAQLALGYSGWPRIAGAVVFFSFTGGLLLMVPSLAVFYNRRPPWRVVAAIVAATALVAWVLPQLPRNTLAYTLAYQAPFVLATGACVWVVLRDSPRRTGDLVVAGMFALLAAHFPIKALLAAWLGTGPAPTDYIASTYALVSQVFSGILLVATGLVLLLHAAQGVIRDSQKAAEIDPLSGLANRRGFDARATRILARAHRVGAPATLLLLDIDHFKAINDTYGHGLGDEAIRTFAAMLARAAPSSSLVARLGGEEFAVLLDGIGIDAALAQAEALRLATLDCAPRPLPAMTVSIGVSACHPSDRWGDALSRADTALYAAKHAGRNRVCPALAVPTVSAAMPAHRAGG